VTNLAALRCCEIANLVSIRTGSARRHWQRERQQAVGADVISLEGISASWLADQLDDHGVVRLRDVFSNEWLEALRAWVTARIADHGDGDFVITDADQKFGSPAQQLMSDPALRRLFHDAATLRCPSAAQNMRCGIPVRSGTGPRARSNLFHYDASVLTMVVPIFLPESTVGSCGELVAIGNKRPFRRFAASHLVDTILTQNSVYRRHVLKAVLDDPEKYIVALQPGDACVFSGYRTYHGNLVCASGLLRATLVLQYGEVHADSPALRVAWRFSRSRRAMRRFQYRSATPVDSAQDITDRIT
jgi:hypothetical protein